MNNIDKSIFSSYVTAETALLNDLATEVRTKGKKARILKGQKYYVKYDDVWYDVTPEQCRIHRLIRNNFNMFVEQLNSAKSDILGVWKNVWGDRLPAIIADLEKGVEICQKYFDAFKDFIIKGGEVETEVEETVEKNEETEKAVEKNEETVSDEKTSSDAPETIGDMTEGAETNAETCVQGQKQADEFVSKTHTNSTSRTAPRTTKTAPHEGTSSTTKLLVQCPNFALEWRLTGFSIN